MNEMSKIKRNPAAVKIANEIKEYDCNSFDMQDALKEIFGPLFEGMLQGEMDNHLGYKSNSKEPKSTKNRRNGSNPKTLKTTMGEVEINAPRDRNGSFRTSHCSQTIKGCFQYRRKGIIHVCTWNVTT